MEAYAARTQNLTKNYRDFCALDKVNISVKRGEIYGLVGDNGAGKTTFLKLLSGQIFPSGGELSLFGKHTQEELKNARSRIGVLIEEAGFYPALTVEQNLEYYRLLKGIPGKQSVAEALASDAQLAVLSLSRYHQSLEEYYMNLKNGGAEIC